MITRSRGCAVQTTDTSFLIRILKKHDKRTALTASTGFPQFVRSSLEAHVDANGNVNTWAFYSTSLPHVLLTSLTETLLPILPSLEDYTCLICTSIAFKPIRLNCSHLFCVRYVECPRTDFSLRSLRTLFHTGALRRCSVRAQRNVPCVEHTRYFKRIDVSTRSVELIVPVAESCARVASLDTQMQR